MKYRFFYTIALLLLNVMAVEAQSFKQLWRQVEQAEEQSLPKSVIEQTDRILVKAREEGSAGNGFKAFMVRKHYREYLTPDSVWTELQKMEQLAEKATAKGDAALWHFLLAAQYATVYNQNYYRLADDDHVLSGEPSEDVRSWSRSQLLTRLVEQLDRVWEDADDWASLRSEEYLPFVEMGEQSAWFGHSMSALLGWESIELLNGLVGMPGEPLYVAAVKRTYERLIGEMERKGLHDGQVWIELEYLKWRSTYDPDFARDEHTGKVVEGRKVQCYQSGLDGLLQRFAASPVCAEVYLEKAYRAFEVDSSALALEYCDRALKAYPRYGHLNKVREFKERILSPLLRASIRETAYPGQPVHVSVTYQNLTSLVLRLMKDGKRMQSHSFQLTDWHDYLPHDTVLSFVAPEVGRYEWAIETNVKQEKRENETLVVSRLKMLANTLENGEVLVKVLDAQSGAPVQDAEVSVYAYREEVRQAVYRTDEAGSVRLKQLDSNGSLLVKKGADKALPKLYVYGHKGGWRDRSDVREELFLLTDRSIYRPGQTVYVKGVAFDREREVAAVQEDKTLELQLMDAGRKVIATKSVVTNEFGSFTTEFVLPEACMNGRFRLQAGREAVYFQVEAYKRPTFEVNLLEPQTAYTLGDTVEVWVDARSFAGVPMGGCSVEYTVHRTVYRWGRGAYRKGSMVTDGKEILDAEGRMAIRVPLVEEAAGADRFAFYTFEVEAAVRSLSGETQEARTLLAVGKAPLEIVPDLEKRICKEKPLQVSVQVLNWNRTPVDVKGRYAWYACSDGNREAALMVEPVSQGAFQSNTTVAMEECRLLPSGNYLLVLSVDDGNGHTGERMEEHVLFSVTDRRPPVKEMLWTYVENDAFDEGHPAVFYVGTSEKDVYLMKHIQGDGVVYATDVCTWLTDTICRVEVPYEQRFGDGITYNFCFVKEGKMYQTDLPLKRRIPGHGLTLKWKVFRDRMRPGQAEEWVLSVCDEKGQPVEAELLATLYDASLDKLSRMDQRFDWGYAPASVFTRWQQLYWSAYYSALFERKVWPYEEWRFDRLTGIARGYDSMVALRGGGLMNLMCKSTAPQMNSAEGNEAPEMEMDAEMGVMPDVEESEVVEMLPESRVELRTDLQETAFFYPFLRTDAEGNVKVVFTLPQSLTTWRFRGYAHTKEMQTGLLTAESVASKEFMLTPNLPRFVREGDVVSLAATLTNLTADSMEGEAVLTLFDPLTEKVIEKIKRAFVVEAQGVVPVTFEWEVTGNTHLLGCRMEAGNGRFGDGEQRLLPVLSDRIGVVETELLPIRGKERKTVNIEGLFNGHSGSAADRRLTVELTGNPNWYAVQALPALTDPNRKDALSWGTALYASALAVHTAEANPVIRKVFEAWRQSGTEETLWSALQRNKELKEVLLEATPWLLEAERETEQMHRIGGLFDLNQMANRQLTALTRLKELQQEDGSWAWYPGMHGNAYVTTYVMTLQARAAMLTGKPLTGMAAEMQEAGWRYLDRHLLDLYRRYRELERRNGNLGLPGAAMDYLYLTAISQRKVEKVLQPAVDYFLQKVENRHEGMADKARAAIVLYHAGRKEQAALQMASLREHLIQTDERGMYFAFEEHPDRWNERRISAHVQVMEAFAQVLPNEAETVLEEMKIWLLKQKQVSNWNSTVATADAVYALLMRGTELTAERMNLSVTIGRKRVDTADSPVPGSGYRKETFTSRDVLNAAHLKIQKQDDGIAWGAVYAQFTEQLSELKEQHAGIGVKKELYVERIQNERAEWERLTDGTVLQVGDKVVVRLILTTDRPMEFVQLKDMRAACMEPVEQHSGPMWKNGVGYYRDQKDAATYYFFDSLAKGVYTLEDSYRVDRAGRYEGGIATMQCLYAPEFAAHSDSEKMVVE